MSELLHFAEHRLQEVALAFMGTMYTARLVWLFRRFKAGRERQPPTGQGTSREKGAAFSLAIIAMPWAMESTRTRWLLYLQFAVFHLAVAAAIVLSFLIPYLPAALANAHVVLAFETTIAAGFIVACVRIGRRFGSRQMRAISSPDDYFSLLLLTVWLGFAFFAAPNRPLQDEGALLTYFVLTAFFLVYVPFSKISHYLYYPITRYYFGRSMGHRGVFPLRRGSEAA